MALCLALALAWVFAPHPDRPQAPPQTATQADAPPPSAYDATPVPAVPSLACRDLYTFVCGRRRDVTSDPSGTVNPNVRGELQALRLYEEILHAHPGVPGDEIDELLVREIFTDKRRKRLEDTYHWVRARMEELIERQPTSVFSHTVKKKLKERLNGTVLELPPPAKIYASEPDLFTKNEIYYETLEDGRRVIRVGGAYILTAKSWFNRVFTFSHELAHAIDPCELQIVPLAVPVYTPLTACFAKLGVLRQTKDPNRCEHSHRLGEVFSDWIAAEITADALEAYADRLRTDEDKLHSAINAVRDLCNQESWIEESETDAYPDPSLRIRTLFGQNPRIRRFLGCPAGSGLPYCHLGENP